MKSLEQLQNPKVWQVLIGLLTGVGLIEFTESDVLRVAGALALVVTNVGIVITAVMAQHGDNTANVEMARSIGPGHAREIPAEKPTNVQDSLVRILEQIDRRMARIEKQAEATQAGQAIGANEVYSLREYTTAMEQRLEMLEQASLREQSMGPMG